MVRKILDCPQLAAWFVPSFEDDIILIQISTDILLICRRWTKFRFNFMLFIRSNCCICTSSPKSRAQLRIICWNCIL